MEQQKWYKFRYAISLLVTLLVLNILIYYKDLPILFIYLIAFITFFLVLFILNLGCANSISNEENDALVRRCQMCTMDPYVKNIETLTKEDFASYTGIYD